MYYICANYRPFGNILVSEKMSKEICNNNLRPPLNLVKFKTSKKKMCSLIERCWATLPDDRPAAKEIGKELKEFKVPPQGSNCILF